MLLMGTTQILANQPQVMRLKTALLSDILDSAEAPRQMEYMSLVSDSQVYVADAPMLLPMYCFTCTPVPYPDHALCQASTPWASGLLGEQPSSVCQLALF